MRRPRVTRFAVATLGLVIAGTSLAACSGSGPEHIRFTFSKREAIGFMTDMVNEYNASQDEVHVEIDTSGVDVVSASFVRGNPPDIMLANYNYETARFVQRCALTDLSGTEAAADVRDDLQPMMDQYGTCEGRQSALPYSIMGASVIYNKTLFAENGIEVPTTWDELIAAADTLQAAGVTPFYATLKDDWTVGQGWYDYALGSSIDVLEFFDALAAEGADVGPDSAVSFEKDFADPLQRMTTLIDEYTNADAANRAYNDGNRAFALGEGAMYLQGPWAFSDDRRSGRPQGAHQRRPGRDDPRGIEAPGSRPRLPGVPLRAGEHPGLQRVTARIRAAGRRTGPGGSPPRRNDRVLRGRTHLSGAERPRPEDHPRHELRAGDRSRNGSDAHSPHHGRRLVAPRVSRTGS
jgi:ABC-type glycerol-3-phosphate transport system substrate-binding protein